MSHRRPNYLLYGILGTVVLMIAAYGVFTKRIPFVHGHRVDIRFASSNQLITGSPVRIAGVDVGKVSKISAGPDNTQIVRVDLGDRGLPLHADATARIRPRLFLEGGFMVEIEPGSPSAPEIPDEGDIPLAQTATPVQFHQILGTFTRPTRANLRGVIAELATSLDRGGAKALGAASRPTAPLLRDAAWIAEAARGVRAHDVSDTIRSTSKVTAALAERDRDLAELVTNLRVTTDAMAGESTNLSATVRELDGLLGRAPEALRSLDTALPPLRRFTSAIRPSLRVAPATLEDLSALLTQLDGLVQPRELPRTISLLEPTAGDLPELVRRLTALFPLVTPVTDCVLERALPVLVAKIDDGHLSSGRPVWQELTGVAAGLSSASQNFDANGFAVRYLAGVGEQSISTHQVGGGSLQGFATQPILGSSPRWLGPNVPLPFRPDAPCTEQAPVNLQARTGPVSVGRQRKVKLGTVKRLPPAKLRKLLAAPKDLPRAGSLR